MDRLDYTKGLPRRLLAIERLLERWPELAPRLHFIQLAVPTRENVDVNGKFGTATGVPIHFMHRELEFDELVALYGAADVMIVLADAVRGRARCRAAGAVGAAWCWRLRCPTTFRTDSF